jgi:Mu transposase, C-terminal domain
MVKDQQVRRLFTMLQTENSQAVAAAQAGMDVKTARKYRRLGRLPSEVAVTHNWRTREDPFVEVWEEVRQELAVNPGLQAATLLAALQRKYPGRFQDGQVRTLQRRIKIWRALEGPAKEVFFSQVHEPGRLCASDFTHLSELGITLAGQPFDHMVYHFVLTYSNWEQCTVCFSESFESLAEGLQNALWALGGVPAEHRTDRLSAAVNNLAKVADQQREPAFTRRYQTLLAHYGLTGRKIQAGKANENGDVEQRHHRFKQALDQALMLRGSRDFATREAYERFVGELIDQLNAGRRRRLAEELLVLHSLPDNRYESCQRFDARVDSGSLIHVDRNAYSVISRLIKETVEVRLYVEHLEVWYAQRLIERLPRLRGRNRYRVSYRHIIDWLIRKPGAFDQYRYRDALFPTSRFRMAYDSLKQTHGDRAAKAYLRILYMAARETEDGVDEALRHLLNEGQPISFEAVEALVRRGQEIPSATQVTVGSVDLAGYDALMTSSQPSVLRLRLEEEVGS